MLSKSIGLNLKINNIGQSQIKNSIANVTNITNFIILNIYSFSYKHYCQFFTGVKFVVYFNLLKTQMPQIRVVGKKKWSGRVLHVTVTAIQKSHKMTEQPFVQYLIPPPSLEIRLFYSGAICQNSSRWLSVQIEQFNNHKLFYKFFTTILTQ